VIPNSARFSAASSSTAAGIVLALVNWYKRPEAALAWAAALVMFVVMAAALRTWRRADPRSTGEPRGVRSLENVPTAVVWAALMMGIPLALTLADSFGLVDGDELARRSTGVLMGVFLAMLGNVMPKNLPPLSQCDGARQQAFHRRAGWTWALCGLASAIGWLLLPIDSAAIATFVPVVTAIVVTIAHLLRLIRHKDKPAHGTS
jgi:hypothetical protein